MTIDIHAHYVSPKLVDLVSGGAFSPELQVKRSADSGDSFSFPTTLSRPIFSKMTDTEKRVKHMQELGIEREVLSTWVDIYGYDLPKEVSRRYHTSINQSLEETVRGNPEQFSFVATVPLPWGEDAAEVLEQAVDKLGAVGSMIGTNVCGANLDDARLEPFWNKSEHLGIPVILHPVNVSGKDRLKSYYLSNLIGNPFDTTIAASSLVFGGVLDRHPKLNVVLLHGGGFFPHDIGRLDHGHLVRSEAKGSAGQPSSYLKRFLYDTVVYDGRILESLVKMVGEQLVVLGSDYPFDMEPKDPMSAPKSVFGEDAGSILDRNAKKIFTRL